MLQGWYLRLGKRLKHKECCDKGGCVAKRNVQFAINKLGSPKLTCTRQLAGHLHGTCTATEQLATDAVEYATATVAGAVDGYFDTS